MGSLFRSEDMTLCQLYLQAEAAYTCVAELGELAIVEFKDLNIDVNAFQRKFVNEIRRCEEMERQLRFFHKELVTDGLLLEPMGANPEAPQARDMVDLEATYETIETELRELNNNLDALRRNYTELRELQQVLRHTAGFLAEQRRRRSSCKPSQSSLGILSELSESRPLPTQAPSEVEMNTFQPPSPDGTTTDQNVTSRYYLSYVAGVIPREKLPGFMRLLWFACRGNILIRHIDILEPMVDSSSGESVMKVVFMAYFQGEQLKTRVKKICEGFRAVLYPCPESPEERQEMSMGVLTRISDIETVLNKSLEQRHRVLVNLGNNLEVWRVKVLKIKAIYHTLNMFHTEQRNYIAECWLPYDQLGTVQTLLNRASETSGTTAPSLLHPMESHEMLPTFHRTNKFTFAFQKIIDAYGVANYKEVNPALFTIISFPFLFSVMFGDAGHGLIMLLFALWMVVQEQKLHHMVKAGGEMMEILFGGRYVILLMGAFSIYSGLIYNDCFSKSINIFGSSWNGTYDSQTLARSEMYMLDPTDPQVFSGDPYPFGLDPVWMMTLNKITFTNSFKKKISVIFGIGQMLLGVMLSLLNFTFFKQYLNIVCEFIPGLLFLLGIFGYLVAEVIAKWIVFSPEESNCAPNILIGFINMFLFKDPHPSDICSMQPWFPYQLIIQKFLVIMAAICAMWMLFAKPVILYIRHRRLRPLVDIASINTSPSDSSPDEDTAQILPEGGQPVDGVDDIALNERDKELEAAAAVEKKRAQESAHINVPNPAYGPPDEEDANANGDLKDPPQEESVASFEKGHRSRFTRVPEKQNLQSFDFSEALIHQAIHTIEYCLGCVSHTASYLRLWALSLAHAELSEVLWSMVLRQGLVRDGYLGSAIIFLVFPAFAVLTVAILLLMEGLSAFLHTLRLHWVEFNSKFYKGDGRQFAPFSFSEILLEQESSWE